MAQRLPLNLRARGSSAALALVVACGPLAILKSCGENSPVIADTHVDTGDAQLAAAQATDAIARWAGSEASVVHIQPVGPDWAMIVRTGTRCWQVLVNDLGAQLPPAATGCVSTGVETQAIGRPASGDAAKVIDAFLEQWLTGKEVELYMAPGVSLEPPAAFEVASVGSIVETDGLVYVADVTIKAEKTLTVRYAVTLAERDGRLEIRSVSPYAGSPIPEATTTTLALRGE